jgi:pyruvate formate lyase activating enzyme
MIKGWVRTTLIDYPGEIATTVFFGGCNFRCPICHNADLVLHPNRLSDIPTDTILEHLEQRTGKITGLVISGGEPCLHPDLTTFIRQVQARNVKVKLDTNGYQPAVLEQLLTEGFVDAVAMDIKAPPHKYARLAGVADIDTERLNASINLIVSSGIPHEFRTTVVSNWITLEDIVEITHWIQGAQRYVLQQFRPRGCLDPQLNTEAPYPGQVLRHMQMLANQQIEEVLLRGI